MSDCALSLIPVEECRLLACGHGILPLARNLEQTAGSLRSSAQTLRAGQAREAVEESDVIPPSADRLSGRQLDVVRAKAQGRTYQETADLLGIHPQTVKNHISKALRDYGVERFDALLVALGWLRVPA